MLLYILDVNSTGDTLSRKDIRMSRLADLRWLAYFPLFPEREVLDETLQNERPEVPSVVYTDRFADYAQECSDGSDEGWN